MGMPATLRAAVHGDLDACWQVHREAMRAPVQATWGWNDAEQRVRFAAAFEPLLTRCVEIEGEVVGLVKVDARGVPVRLLQVALRPAFQRRGIGSAVVRAVLAEAAPRPVWLQVLHANPQARALYQRLGFVDIGRTATHVRMWRSSPLAVGRIG